MTTPQYNKVIAIDPGSKHSAWMVYDGKPMHWAKVLNEELLQELRNINFQAHKTTMLVIESMVSYGMTVGDEVFAACRWSGRFEEAWKSGFGEDACTFLRRPEIKLHICNASRATDKDVREALIQRWGGLDVAVGGKKCEACKGRGSTKGAACSTCRSSGLATPRGPLHGITADCWSALAIATTWADKNIPTLARAS